MNDRATETEDDLILIADDDDDLRVVYAEFLRASGFRVIEAENGWKTLDRVRETKPRLLILDLWMPGLNGLEVLERLRHEPTAARMKIVMLSNLGEADARLESFEGGAVAYLVKGIALDELLARIRRAIDARLVPLIESN